MNKGIKKIIFLGIALLPFLALAAPTLKDVLSNLTTILDSSFKLFLTLGVFFLMWNIVDYIMAGSGDPKEAAKAVKMITYSIIALFIMISVWGLVKVIQNTLGIQSESAPSAPTS